MNDSPSVFVDSDAFVALAVKTDSNYHKAQRILSHLLKKSINFITSNYVFSETITVISQKAGHDAAITFINNLKGHEAGYAIKWIDQLLEIIAIEIFKKQTSKNVSFVDCTNMAVVRHDNLDAIFSFDEIYRKNGFKLANML